VGSSRIHTQQYRRLCKQLKLWREHADLTQRRLAEVLGEVPSYVAKWELRERRIDPLEFIAWASACGLDPSEAIKQIK